MIYISTGCSKFKNIDENLRELISWGYENIELTGGFNREDIKNFDFNIYSNLNLQCHNYFPPPSKHFVLNLSGRDEVYKNSLGLIREALAFSKKHNSCRYGIHAGFRVDPKVSELGQKFKSIGLISLDEAESRMINSLQLLNKESEGIKLYVENNVYSAANFQSYGGENPFLLCQFSDYERLSKEVDLNVLLDIGHLKVSCTTLGLDFDKELAKFLEVTDYIHVSDNDGTADQNLALSRDSMTFDILKKYKSNFKDKTYTVEVYNGEDAVRETVLSIEALRSN
ncbi:hypothetical protein ABMA77_15380 [Halobacteriovorax sp. RZ-1]|uniref:sugar phosphate isomerase/epimerase family protein n=1 Tax=unclassified Halobacteriovorax TaxID=2639665 RepID=UPI003714AE8C